MDSQQRFVSFPLVVKADSIDPIQRFIDNRTIEKNKISAFISIFGITEVINIISKNNYSIYMNFHCLDEDHQEFIYKLWEKRINELPPEELLDCIERDKSGEVIIDFYIILCSSSMDDCVLAVEMSTCLTGFLEYDDTKEELSLGLSLSLKEDEFVRKEMRKIVYYLGNNI